jgi:release factor glutamine methyltransferase
MKAELPQTWRTPPRETLNRAAESLAAAGVDSARLDAELLMAAAFNCERTDVIAGAIENSDEAMLRFEELVGRRVAREPLAYIVGKKEFFSLELEVSASVLIPRPETEVLVGAALETASRGPTRTILDIGTGSGAIALAIAAGLPQARVVATDVSAAALEVARRNAALLELGERIEFYEGDCWAAVPASMIFDLVVSNPPYIEDSELDRLQPEVSNFEPRVALAGGEDGLDFYRKLSARVREFLKPGGELMVEIGDGQAAAVAELFRGCAAADIAVINDFAGRARVVRARFV